MNSSAVNNPANTPNSFSRFATWRAAVIAKNKANRKRGLGGLWSFAVLAWAALSMLQVMQVISMATPIPVPSGSPPAPSFAMSESLWLWFGVSLGGFGFALVRKKAFRRTLFAPRGFLPTLMSLFVGAFIGTNLFTLSFLDYQAQEVVSNFSSYPELKKSMVSFEYATPAQKEKWFHEDGSLKEELKPAWCANALPRVQTYADITTSPGEEGVAISALLAQGFFQTMHANGCINDDEWLAAMAKMHAAAARGSRQQSIMERMSWFAPVLYAMAQAHPQIVDRVLFSPRRACQALAWEVKVDPGKAASMCMTLPENRAVSKDELPGLRARLKALKDAT